ncbi:hypothetical protein MG293_018731, partial [Ovis ammon polii]
MSAFRFWSGPLMLLGFLCPRSSPCGISTHIEIGKWQPLVTLPVLSGQFHDVSESTHWTPFLNASIHYIRKNYPLPWDEDTEKLVAFLFGITSHMVADVNWHSLGIEQGFLRTMAAVKSKQPLFDSNAFLRYVPVEDLLGIYKELYGRVVITKRAILYPTYSGKSPFLVEQFQEYFLGGLEDMAFWSTNIYHLTSYMLKNGTSSSKVQKNGFHKNVTAALTKTIGKHINYTKRGVVFSVDSWTMDSLSFMYKSLERSIREMFIGSSQPLTHVSSPSASYYLSLPYTRLGWAMTSADLNQDGYGDLVVGAPGYSHPGRVHVGRVYLIYGNDLGLPPVDLDLDKEAHGVLEGFQPSGRFGSAVAVLDFNVDGVPDLAVGAPSVGSEKLTYTSSLHPNCLKAELKVVGFPFSLQDTYCNLGWTLLAADVNADSEPDLVIGSPFAPGGGKQKGIVAAFYSGSSYSDQGKKLNVEAANWVVRGEEDFAWLGYSLHGVSVNNRTLLLAGSPTWKNTSRYGGPLPSPGKQTPQRKFLSWTVVIYCVSQAMGKLGTSLSSGYVMLNRTRTQVLLVGAPTQDVVSKVSFLTMTLHQGGSTRMYELTPDSQPSLLSTFSGNRRFSRFGGVLHLSDLDNDGLDEIIIAAPLRITDATAGLMGGEDGRVYVYNGKRIAVGDVTGKCKSWVTPCPEEKVSDV